MRRYLFLAAGSVAIAASYLAVIFDLAPSEGVGPVTVASIALPALVSGLVFTAWIAMQARRERETSGLVGELHAQLARKEIEISRLASIDELTGLYTRHHFDDTIRLEFKRAERHGRPLTLLLLEIDDLAELGEHIGAMSKGYLLSEVGAVLRTMLRINDAGCRYSTDALAVLMPETDEDQARMVAQKVNGLIERHEFMGKRSDGGFKLTVSQGAAVVPSAAITTHQELLKTAEGALAHARSSGFGQVHIVPPAPVAAGASAADSELLAS
jgi:diguanylate cyclase (GGDEF)-like protein